MFKKILWVLLVIIIGGLSGIIANRYLFPYLSTTDFFSKNKFLKKGVEDVTVINKTEQVYMKEDTSVTKTAAQISSSVVNIVSYSNPDLKKSSIKSITSSQAIKNGTGIIATSDGLIMTYAGAIIPNDPAAKTDTPAYKYKAMLYDGNTYDADLVDVDPYSNLAFLKINASNLPAASFGNSDDFKAGEKVIAVGNSLGSYENMYTSGVLNSYDNYYNLSGKTVSSSEKLEGVFRSDLPREEFYVGGPIIDYSGQIVGIIGSVEKPEGTDYFQIPSNKVKVVIDRVIKKEWDKTPQLGLYYIPLTPSHSIANSINQNQGALVFSPSGQQGLAILAGSPAANSGIKIYDIITKVGNDVITSDKSLSDLLYGYKKGDQIELTVIRDGAEMKLSVQL